MSILKYVTNKDDILTEYLNTPISDLLEYHNLNRDFDSYEAAELLVGMCMDNRKRLNIPEKFAYIIRTGGANMQHNNFHIAYALSVANVKYIALIAHSQCGMVNVAERKDLFINGLIENAGVDAQKANEYFESSYQEFGIKNEIDFTLEEVRRLRKLFPSIVIAPLYYKVEDNNLYQIIE